VTALNPQSAQKDRSAQRPYVISAAIVILIILIFNAVLLWQESRQIERNAEIDTENASIMLAKNISAIFDKADTLLQAVEFQYKDDKSLSIFNPQRFNEYLMRTLEWAPGFDNIGYIDVNGFYRHGKDSANPIALGDREFFIALRERALGSGSGPMVFSMPIFTRFTQQWALVMARRVQEEGGAFGGVVIIRWNLDHLTELLASIQMGTRGTVVLRSSDMAQISSYPIVDGNDSGLGNRRVSETLRASIQRSPESGFYRAVSPIDGIERYHAYRKVSNYPFYVIAGQVTSPGLFAWSGSTPILHILSGLMILIVLFGAWHMNRLTQRRIHGEVNNFAQRVLSASPVAMLLLTRQGTVTMANPAAERLFDYEKDKLVGVSAYRLQLEDANLAPNQRQVESEETMTLVKEASYQRRDGSQFTALCGLSGLPDGTGTTHYYLETVVDITELKSLQEQLRELAQTDKLTGLLNRHSGDVLIDEAIHDASLSRTPFSVIMGDIDLFKRVNDLFGHPAGDRVLVSVASLLKDAIRNADHCIRWGGEEFLIALPGCSLVVAQTLAERMRTQIAELRDPQVGKVTMSFGVGAWIKSETSAAFISRVDQALYQAKRRGRNRVALAADLCLQPL